jgi:nicotinate-nucleotide pyrophosphorylase (carboxylating)
VKLTASERVGLRSGQHLRSHEMHGNTVDWDELLRDAGVQTLIELALREDLGAADVTTEAIFDTAQQVRAAIVTRSETVACGLPLAESIFRRVDDSIAFKAVIEEGSPVKAGTTLAELSGDVRGLLTAERCALNFLMRLCGVAMAARVAASAIPDGCRAQVYDTRKTTPGWRHLDKAAVRIGGAQNHRFGLYDAVLIKDNHVAAAGSVAQAVQLAKAYTKRMGHLDMTIEVEIDSLSQLNEALEAGPDIILLDNFDLEDVRTAVAQVEGRAVLEVSGGVTLQTIPAIARTGVGRISMGALTHTVRPADLSLEMNGGA